MTATALHAHYVVDDTGQKISVILPMNEFEELLEALADLAALAERRDEPTVAHAEVIAGLKADGLL